MYLVGLTGGIAAGKSAVASRWVELGGIEIDADQLARDVVEPGTEGLAEVVEAFGEGILKAGRLDRAALGAVVFSDEKKRRQLEKIIHPRVKALASEHISQTPKDAIVIYSVPLLVEASVDLPFDLVVTVEAPEAVRADRLVSHRGMTKEEARARIKNQATSAQRANHADVILNSNQPLTELLKDADALWKRILREASESQRSSS